MPQQQPPATYNSHDGARIFSFEEGKDVEARLLPHFISIKLTDAENRIYQS